MVENQAFGKEEENGRQKMGEDVDALIVNVEPAGKAGMNRVRLGTIAIANAVIVLVPFWYVVVREKCRPEIFKLVLYESRRMPHSVRLDRSGLLAMTR